MSKNDEAGYTGWWSTLPGILTAIAGIITAIGGLIGILYQSGASKEKPKPPVPIKHLAHSEPGDHPPANIAFVNSFGRDIDIVWIDANGTEQFFKHIPAGGTYSVATFATHLWLIKDAATGEQMLLVTSRGARPHNVTVDVSQP